MLSSKIFRRTAAVAAWVVGFMVVGGGAASAAVDDYVAASTAPGLLLVGAVAVLIPLLVDVVTKRVASAAVKAAVLLALNLLSGVLLEWLNALNTPGAQFDLVAAGNTAVLTFLVSVAAFFGVTSPIGLSGRSGAIQAAVPGGIGKPGRHAAPEGD